MEIDKNYYELFSIPQSFRVDKELLSQKYRQLQRQLHPDNFANNGAAEQRIAVQYASYINTAYQTLKSPLLLAEYLLEIAGHPVNSQSLTLNDNEFLLKQMEWREALSDMSEKLASGTLAADISTELDELAQNIKADRKHFLKDFEACYESEQFDKAKNVIAKLHFVEKMLTNIDVFEERLFA
jgi:molecular chaperone HscB